MSLMGQTPHIHDVRDMSARAPTPDKSLRCPARKQGWRGAPDIKANESFAVHQLTVANYRLGSRPTNLRRPHRVRFSPDSDRIAAVRHPSLEARSGPRAAHLKILRVNAIDSARR